MGASKPRVVCTSVYILMTFSLVEPRRIASTTTRTSTAFSAKIYDILTYHKIIPDVIRAAPDDCLTVTYLNGLKPSFGNLYESNDVQIAPYFIRWPCQSNLTYLLLMTDPDVPSRDNPALREFRHWLVVNILGPNIMSGEVISKYTGPQPGKGTGSHRYVFLVYKQPHGRIDFSDEWGAYHDLGEGEEEVRTNFSTKRFVDKYKLGHPIAINFFTCSGDS